MQGEFRGDFTRDTFNPSKQFLRVFMQQGRVQLDADWNEQVSILLNYMQTLATDLIGPYGGPKDNCGFRIIGVDELNSSDESSPVLDDYPNLSKLQIEQFEELRKKLNKLGDSQKNFLIGPGHYYVHGKLCKNENFILFSDLPNYPFSKEQGLEGRHLIYLDVWERHISFIEDESDLVPGIREIALGKADTATRSKLVWQIKIKPIPESIGTNTDQSRNTLKDPAKFKEFLQNGGESDRLKPGTGLLRVRAVKPSGVDSNEPCTISPDSRYRGAENQLYRVEIHTPGNAETATFKWSRENGSVIFSVEDIQGTNITLGHLGWDDRFSLNPGDWVELVDDNSILRGEPGDIKQVDSVDPMELSIKLKEGFLGSGNDRLHPLLRRWDQRENSNIVREKGTIKVKEEGWIELEEGIEINFYNTGGSSFYNTGDYWLIPARTATGDVEWPKNLADNALTALPPHGVDHYYAPLWVIEVPNESGNQINIPSNGDCRCQFLSLCQSLIPPET